MKEFQAPRLRLSFEKYCKIPILSPGRLISILARLYPGGLVLGGLIIGGLFGLADDLCIPKNSPFGVK